jgi:hypothetical protein
MTAGILAAVGAFLGAVTAAAASYAFQERRYTKRARKRLLDGYLAPLQDACESLWYRVENLAFREGASVMKSDYHDVTTLYVVGRVLRIERMLALEGRYAEVWRTFPAFRTAPGRRELDRAVKTACESAGAELHHYERVRLGELAVERTDEGFHQRTFLEFEHALRPDARATAAVNALRHQTAVAPLLDCVRSVALSLARVTTMESPLTHERAFTSPAAGSERQPSAQPPA